MIGCLDARWLSRILIVAQCSEPSPLGCFVGVVGGAFFASWLKFCLAPDLWRVRSQALVCWEDEDWDIVHTMRRDSIGRVLIPFHQQARVTENERLLVFHWPSDYELGKIQLPALGSCSISKSSLIRVGPWREAMSLKTVLSLMPERKATPQVRPTEWSIRNAVSFVCSRMQVRIVGRSQSPVDRWHQQVNRDRCTKKRIDLIQLLGHVDSKGLCIENS